MSLRLLQITRVICRSEGAASFEVTHVSRVIRALDLPQAREVFDGVGPKPVG